MRSAVGRLEAVGVRYLRFLPVPRVDFISRFKLADRTRSLSTNAGKVQQYFRFIWSLARLLSRVAIMMRQLLSTTGRIGVS
eukprot:1611429-Rhodomonas_salina.1